MFDNMNFNKMFGKIKHGMCRLSLNGIAVKCGENEYKTYDVNTNQLVNVADFAFDVGEDMFFVFPTNVVTKGDIILLDDGPACVINHDTTTNCIKVFKYRTSSIVEIVPESHVFMGNTFFYAKIVSMFGDMSSGSMNIGQIMQYKMMMEMFKDESGKSGGNDIGKIAMISMFAGNGSGIFSNMQNMFGNMFGNTTEDVRTTSENSNIDDKVTSNQVSEMIGEAFKSFEENMTNMFSNLMNTNNETVNKTNGTNTESEGE